MSSNTYDSGWSVGDKCSYASFGKYHEATIRGIKAGTARPFILESEDGSLIRAAEVW